MALLNTDPYNYYGVNVAPSYNIAPTTGMFGIPGLGVNTGIQWSQTGGGDSGAGAYDFQNGTFTDQYGQTWHVSSNANTGDSRYGYTTPGAGTALDLWTNANGGKDTGKAVGFSATLNPDGTINRTSDPRYFSVSNSVDPGLYGALAAGALVTAPMWAPALGLTSATGATGDSMLGVGEGMASGVPEWDAAAMNAGVPLATTPALAGGAAAGAAGAAGAGGAAAGGAGAAAAGAGAGGLAGLLGSKSILPLAAGLLSYLDSKSQNGQRMNSSPEEVSFLRNQYNNPVKSPWGRY